MINPNSVWRKGFIEIGNIQSNGRFRSSLHRILLYRRRSVCGRRKVKLAACH
jgi:hypothetical protein